MRKTISYNNIREYYLSFQGIYNYEDEHECAVS